MNKMLIGFAGAVQIAPSASAQVRTYTGTGGAISDLAGQRLTNFLPNHDFEQIMNFALDVDHTWIGGLFISVTHKTANPLTIVLVDWPGVPQSTFGNSDDLNGI